MSYELTPYKLEDALSALIDYRGKTPVKTASGVPLITAKIIKNGRIERPTEFIAADNYESWMRRGIPKAGDVVLTVEAPLGEVAQLGSEKIALAQRVVTLRGKPGVLDSTYLCYLLQSKELQDKLKERATGSTVLGIKQSELRKIVVNLPTETQQKKAVSLLKRIDESIDNLNKQNSALEGTAQALFQSWFVNFNPVHAKAAGSNVEGFSDAINQLFPSEFIDSPYGQIPKGWSWESLDEHITYLNGLALQKFPPIEGEATLPVLKIAQLRAGRTDPTVLANRKMKPEFIVKDGDIIFSWSGSLEVKVWTGGEAALNQHLFKVFSEKHPAWFCYQATLRHLASFRDTAASKATTMGHIQRHHLTEAKIAVPPEELMPKFSDIFKPLHDSIVVNGLLVRELEELRNHVLPRLVTGRLTVEAAAEAVQELAAA